MRQIQIFLRNLQKSKSITAINFTGLVMAILSTLFIFEYVFYERSYDTRPAKADQIYRLAYDRYNSDGLMWRTANSFCPAPIYLKKNYPEVLDYVTITRNSDVTISYKRSNGSLVSFNEEKAYNAMPSIFSVFSIPLVLGDTGGLKQPNTVAISERAAKKLFGSENPIGKNIQVNDKKTYTIVVLYKTMPANSHLKSDFLFSLQLPVERLTNWRADMFHNYVVLKPGTDYKQFAAKAFPRMIADNYATSLKEHGCRDEFYLQPIKSIHLYSNIEYETELPGNGIIISILFWFSIFFLVIAWINYTNLMTSQSIERARETGIKKVCGVSYGRLIGQFLFESVLFNLICLVTAVVLFLLFNPLFKAWIGIESNAPLFPLAFYTIGGGAFLLGIFVSGFYPAFVISSFEPMRVLKGAFQHSSNSLLIRKTLITIQFIVAILLITGTSVVFAQVKYLQGKDSGINYQSKMVIKAPKLNLEQESYKNKLEVLQNELAKLPGVSNYTFVSDVPGKDILNFFASYRKGMSTSDKKDYFRTDVDYRYASFFSTKLLAGRFFNQYDRPEHHYVIVNESAAKRLGFKTPLSAINQPVVKSGKDSVYDQIILGVINDFNYTSLKIKPVPTFFTLNDNRKMFVCLAYKQTQNKSNLIAETEKVYQSFFPDSPFEYFFLKDKVESVLGPDKLFATLFGSFSILTVLVAIIGVLGLLIITINRSIKQMGIRKVLGAEVPDLIKLLSRQFVWPLILSIFISVPMATYGLKRWVLDSYIYHIELNWLYCALPVLFLLVLLCIVVVIMAYRVARINPVEALRYE